jgi:hypothetical protein
MHISERGVSQRMEQAEEQRTSRSGRQEYMPVTKEHRSDASQYERPLVTVDVVMMSLRQGDLPLSLTLFF